MSLAAPHRLDDDIDPASGQPADLARLSAEQLSEIRHDLANPLAAITGFAELLHTRGDEETRKEATTRILEAAARLSLALEDILTLVALGSGALVLHTESVDLGTIVAEALAARERTTTRHHPTDRRQEEWPRVEADAERLVQALRLVIDHTIADASSSEAPEIVAEQSDGLAIVSVTSTRSDGSRLRDPAAAGAVGISVAHALIELHGGRLRIEREPGQRATARCSVPLAVRARSHESASDPRRGR